jgi:hypothetical protein
VYRLQLILPTSSTILILSAEGSEVVLRGFLVPCHTWLREHSCKKRMDVGPDVLGELRQQANDEDLCNKGITAEL